MSTKLFLSLLTITFAAIAAVGVITTDSAEISAILDSFPASILSYSMLQPPTVEFMNIQ